MKRRVAWLVLGATALAAVLLVGALYLRLHHQPDLSTRTTTITTQQGVHLKTVVSLAQHNSFYDMVADVSIVNDSDEPVYYSGLPCYAPAQVKFVSTLVPPAGPSYTTAAEALRAHVLDYRRSPPVVRSVEHARSGRRGC